jgi:hypothetical protein
MLMPICFSAIVTIPRLPSVLMKAKASGTPAKLVATAEKLVTIERRIGGAPGCRVE